MDAAELEALLERELDDLNDDADEAGLEDALYTTLVEHFRSSPISDKLANQTNGLDAELCALVESSNLLIPSGVTEKQLPLEIDLSSTEEYIEKDVTVVRSEYLDENNGKLQEIILSEDDQNAIKELLELMVESVERCAPICERTILSKLDPQIVTPLPTILLNDAQIEYDVNIESIDQSQVHAEQISQHEIGMLDDRLKMESQLHKDSISHSAQRQDLLVWDEAREYKEKLELDRVRQEERRLKREQEKRNALKEKAAVSAAQIVFHVPSIKKRIYTF